jgi:propanediol utilization protein
MNPKQVGLLEEELESAISRVVRRLAKARQIDLLPSKRIYHLMAKAAVSVYEAADEVSEKR